MAAGATISQLGDARTGKLADNLTGFGRALRRTGVRVDAARMALAGVRPSAPFDEVVEAMRRVGAALPAELRETALGGLAACPSCRGCAGR